MLVARLHDAADLRVAQEPAPPEEPGLSLVRVTAIGICGSDLHWWAEAGIGDALLERPLVPGHEAAGVIEQGPRRGERVAIDPAIACDTCRPCRAGYRNLCLNIRFAGHGPTDGAMREYLTWPSHLLHQLPDSVTDADGALLEPLGVAIHATDLGHLPLAGTAAVVGCGPIGLLLIQVLLAAGAASVIAFEPLPHRLAAAGRLGADVLVDPAQAVDQDWLSELTKDGVDVVFEMAGTNAGVQLAMAAVRPGGRVVLGGIPSEDLISFQASAARRKGLTIAMVRRMNETYPRAISLAESGKVDLTIVSHRFPLSKAQDAFAVAAGRGGLKVLVEPGEDQARS
jgi:L-iditol 2-dehydrogenase